MDYSSAIANDSGRDPWATSPQHDRSTFNQANTNSHEAPPTNSFHQPPAPDGDDEEHDQNAQLPPQNNQYSSRQHQQQSYDNSTRQEPQRYHHARPQHPPQQYSHNQQPPPQSYQQQQQQQQMQPPQPRKQYKLQAKITALERTGRKDPVLRFDVYVCCTQSCCLHLANTIPRRTCPSSAQPNSAMFDAPTPSSSSLPTISSRPTPTPLCLPFHLRSLLLVSVPKKMKSESRLQCSAG
jgi:hypothetical protein